MMFALSKGAYLNKEVSCTEPSTSARIPCFDRLSFVAGDRSNRVHTDRQPPPRIRIRKPDFGRVPARGSAVPARARAVPVPGVLAPKHHRQEAETDSSNYALNFRAKIFAPKFSRQNFRAKFFRAKIFRAKIFRAKFFAPNIYAPKFKANLHVRFQRPILH
jgi:hypothetical protein